MKKLLLNILLVGIMTFCLTSCGTSSNESLNNDDKKVDGKEKEIICKFGDNTQHIYLNGSKLVKVINTTDDMDYVCEDRKQIFGRLNDIKGTSFTIECGDKTHHEETYIIDEIEDYYALDDMRILSTFYHQEELSELYFNRETHDFSLDFWLEGKKTQHFTCEEK